MKDARCGIPVKNGNPSRSHERLYKTVKIYYQKVESLFASSPTLS